MFIIGSLIETKLFSVCKIITITVIFPDKLFIIFVFVCLVTLVMSDSLQPMDLAHPPGSSVHWLFQARILEWAVVSCSRESSRPRDQTQVLGLLHFLTQSLPLYHKGSPLYYLGRINFHSTTFASNPLPFCPVKENKRKISFYAGSILFWFWNILFFSLFSYPNIFISQKLMYHVW